MTKHFPGGGPQKDGEDPHFPYGREQVYPGNNFDYHLIPFEAAFAAGTAQIMPYYGMPVGTPLEEVGFGFNQDVITGLLREKLRLRRRGLHRLGPAHRLARSAGSRSRRAPGASNTSAARSGPEDPRRRRRPVRRRSLPGGDRRAGA